MNIKKILKYTGCVILVLLAGAMILTGVFTYKTKYKITEIDSSVSSDGNYTLLFQSVGEADMPFGDSHTRIILKHGRRTVDKVIFDVANDGKILGPDNWSIVWKSDSADITVSGEEQDDTMYTLFFRDL